jgi:hypothetical protein
MVATAIMAIVSVGFASMLKYVVKATTAARNVGQGQEDVRQGLAKIERILVHTNEVTVASQTFVEFIVDIDQSPGYNKDADADGDGIPNYRDGDRDNDVNVIDAASATWRYGYNLKDDDEDGDRKADVRGRIWWSTADRKLYFDMSVDEDAWGARRQTLMLNVSSFTLTCFGNKGNDLGRSIDANGDGIISQNEMDSVVPSTAALSGLGDNNGKLDTKGEKRYITTIRLYLSSDSNRDAKTDYGVETDVYPPLLPLKSR